jgi:hypothetical protein
MAMLTLPAKLIAFAGLRYGEDPGEREYRQTSAPVLAAAAADSCESFGPVGRVAAALFGE